MIQVFVWLAALASTSGVAGLLALMCVRGRVSWPVAVASTCVLSISFCLFAADVLRALLELRLDSGLLLLLIAGVLVLAAAAIVIQFGLLCSLVRNTGWQAKRWTVLVVLACQILVAGWIGCRFQQTLDAATELPMLGSVDIEAIPGEALLTRKGRLVPVYRSRIHPDLERFVETAGDEFANRRIVQAGQDEQANCHGWVFTGGKYLLTGRCVETILSDNDYEVVCDPRPGDIIVYRDESGRIQHSGLVRLASEDGLVLIESKWGIDERFLHLPQDQHYSQRFSYYRSQGQLHKSGSTADHLVQAVRVLPGNAIVSQQPEEALVAIPQSADPMYETWARNQLPPGEGISLGAE